MASQAAVSLANNNGDIAKTVEGLGSKETLKSITTAMLMAGLSGGGTPSTFMGHVSQQTANALYRIGIESAVYGRADGKGVTLSAVAGAIGGKLSAEIGTLNSAGEIGFFTHKVMHALNGAGQGLIVGGEKGMAAGALGATLAVTVAEVMMPTNGIDKMDPKDRPPYTEAEIQKAQAVSRVVAAMVALGVGMEASDVSIAIMAAITAVDHNCAKSARKAKGYLGAEGTEPEDDEVAGISKSGDEETKTADDLGSKEKSDTQLATVGDKEKHLNQTKLNWYKTKPNPSADRGRSKDRTSVPPKRSGSPSEKMQGAINTYTECIEQEKAYRADPNTSFLSKLGSIFQEHCYRQMMNDVGADHGRRQVDKAVVGVVSDLKNKGSIDPSRLDQFKEALPTAIVAAVSSFGGMKGPRIAKGGGGKIPSANKGKSVRFADETAALDVAKSGKGINLTESGRMYGTHRELTKASAQDSHHVIQHAAVKDIPGYHFLDAPTVQLNGPSQIIGTEHQLATKIQRSSGGGTYSAERWIGYKAMRKAGVSESEARSIMNHTDEYFHTLGVKPNTSTSIPGNRKTKK